MSGIEHYRSAAGLHVIRVHYSADPERDPATPQGRAWVDVASNGYPGGIASAAWRQEQEIDWDAAGGELVFPYFETYRSQIVIPPFAVPDSWPIYGSFDYGHRNPASFHYYTIDFDGDVYSVWEFYAAGKGYRTMARAIRSSPFWPRLSFLPIADPSIWAKTQEVTGGDENEKKSIAQLFFELPESERILFAPGKKGGDITVAEKITGDLWEKESLHAGKKPRLQLFATCPFQIWELSKLRYKDWSGTMAETRNLQESIVDKDNHAWDDLKMFFTMFFMAPVRPEEDKMAALRSLDPASYAEWKSLAERMGETVGKSTVGEFEDYADDED